MVLEAERLDLLGDLRGLAGVLLQVELLDLCAGPQRAEARRRAVGGGQIELDADVSTVDNNAGILGGVRLWDGPPVPEAQ